MMPDGTTDKRIVLSGAAILEAGRSKGLGMEGAIEGRGVEPGGREPEIHPHDTHNFS